MNEPLAPIDSPSSSPLLAARDMIVLHEPRRTATKRIYRTTRLTRTRPVDRRSPPQVLRRRLAHGAVRPALGRLVRRRRDGLPGGRGRLPEELHRLSRAAHELPRAGIVGARARCISFSAARATSSSFFCAPPTVSAPGDTPARGACAGPPVVKELASGRVFLVLSAPRAGLARWRERGRGRRRGRRAGRGALRVRRDVRGPRDGLHDRDARGARRPAHDEPERADDPPDGAPHQRQQERRGRRHALVPQPLDDVRVRERERAYRLVVRETRRRAARATTRLAATARASSLRVSLTCRATRHRTTVRRHPPPPRRPEYVLSDELASWHRESGELEVRCARACQNKV